MLPSDSGEKCVLRSSFPGISLGRGNRKRGQACGNENGNEVETNGNEGGSWKRNGNGGDAVWKRTEGEERAFRFHRKGGTP